MVVSVSRLFMDLLNKLRFFLDFGKRKKERDDYLTGETGGRVDLENLWNF